MGFAFWAVSLHIARHYNYFSILGLDGSSPNSKSAFVAIFGNFLAKKCPEMHISNLGRTHSDSKLKNNCGLLSSIFNVERPFQRHQDKTSWKCRAGWKSTPLENSKMRFSQKALIAWFIRLEFQNGVNNTILDCETDFFVFFCWGSWAFRTHVIRAVSALDVESSAVPACVFLSFTTSVCCIKVSTQVFLLSGCVEDWGLALVNVRMQNNLLLWFSSSRDEICQTCQRQRVYVSYHVDRGRLLPVNGFS